MAIDTAQKRFSMMGFGIPWVKHIIPDGVNDAIERAVYLNLYAMTPAAPSSLEINGTALSAIDEISGVAKALIDELNDTSL